LSLPVHLHFIDASDARFIHNMAYPGQHLQRCWHLFDATGQTTGRLAMQVANVLRGKHKPTFLPNKDMGDYVVVINAEKVRTDDENRSSG
jgi:ribosomal protein L13